MSFTCHKIHLCEVYRGWGEGLISKPPDWHSKPPDWHSIRTWVQILTAHIKIESQMHYHKPIYNSTLEGMKQERFWGLLTSHLANSVSSILGETNRKGGTQPPPKIVEGDRVPWPLTPTHVHTETQSIQLEYFLLSFSYLLFIFEIDSYCVALAVMEFTM